MINNNMLRKIVQKGVEPTSASLKVFCKTCNAWVVLGQKDFTDAIVEGAPEGTTQAGVLCPHCQTFYPAAYDSASLKKRRRDLQAMRIGALRKSVQRHYMNDYRAFQVEMEEWARKRREEREAEEKSNGTLSYTFYCPKCGEEITGDQITDHIEERIGNSDEFAVVQEAIIYCAACGWGEAGWNAVMELEAVYAELPRERGW